MLELYCDGGCIAGNPSPHGGTWAWCLVEDDRIVHRGSGRIKGPATNNHTELLAAVRALEANGGAAFAGVLHTDSQVTVHRLTASTAFAGVPYDLRQRCLDVRRARRWTVKLVKGHPTRRDLLDGHAGGRPVSRWNAWCDQECQRLAKEFLAKLRR